MITARTHFKYRIHLHQKQMCHLIIKPLINAQKPAIKKQRFQGVKNYGTIYRQRSAYMVCLPVANRKWYLLREGQPTKNQSPEKCLKSSNKKQELQCVRKLLNDVQKAGVSSSLRENGTSSSRGNLLSIQKPLDTFVMI